jgi:predicted ester cyclase
MSAEQKALAFRWTATATHAGEGLGIAPTNKRVRFEGMGFVRCQGGQVVEGWNVFDQLGMMQQVGAGQ